VLNAKDRFSGGYVESTITLERTFLGHYERRHDLVVDARYFPPVATTSSRVVLFIVSRGWFEFTAPHAALFEAPATFLVSEDAYDGAHGERTVFFRSSGSPFVGYDLRFERTALLPLLEREPARVDLDEEVYRLVDGAPAIAPDDTLAWTSQTRAILLALARQGVIKEELAHSIRATEPRFARLWNAAALFARRFYAITTLDEMSNVLGLSRRQAARDLKSFFDTFSLARGGFREETRRLRLRVAVIGLSAKGATVDEIARATGYGSVHAMTRAFRDAGLPPPGLVRAELGAIPRASPPRA
jgi:AraC-like DNA-binding protein